MFKILLLLSFAASPAITRVADNKLFSCRSDSIVSGDFKCGDGSGCIESRYKCDGVNNCLDGSDEALCFETLSNGGLNLEEPSIRRKRQAGNCKRNEWQCRDGTCISFDGKCDGAVDCPDRSDETQALCRNMQCQSNWFRCTYGACVDGTAPCNGIVECADSSDELLPSCRNVTMETKGKFRCQDGTLIDSSDLCDGTVTCPDASDETVSSCADKSCPSYLFQCAYGACVDNGADCDGKQDCADGSDESPELCNRIGTPVTPGTGTVVTKPPPTSGACVLPEYPKHGTYSVENAPNASPGQSASSYVLNAKCQRGYGFLDTDGVDANGTLQVYCINGAWYSHVPDCVRFCELKPDPSVAYWCQIPKTTGFRPCDRYVAPGTSVNPICNSPNYYSPEAQAYMKCIEGSFDRVTICKPECGRITPEGLQLVVGGTNAKRGEIPWHVGIYKKTTTPYMQICGGSLVSNTVVLSAAHCFWTDVTKQQPATDFAAAVGKIYRPWNDKMDTDAQKSDIKDIHIPDLFQGNAANFQVDIAVVMLVTAFEYKTYVRPVCLNFDANFDRRQLQDNSYGKVAGWGLTAENGNASPVLKVVDLPYIDINKCINTLPPSFREYITADKFCAGYTNGTALCQGDSGGGLAFPATELGVERYYLRGIVSTAPSTDNKCNANTYTTFTKITKHDDFIKTYI